MEHILIVDSGEKNRAALADFLKLQFHFKISFASSGAEAKRKLNGTTYGVILVNAPLGDEFGSDLLLQASGNTSSGLVLLAKNESVPELEGKMSEHGVFVVGKPLQKDAFCQTVRMALGVYYRMGIIAREKQKLQKKLEDVKLTEKAKFILMQQLCISENEAHKIIEKRAMDGRITKRTVAEDVLEQYAE